ncbi:DUF2461 domain-containing protein [Anaerotignum lactatifermentans]|uniref:DUF2461 domain-containing protein n=1 Tax=Anaerotignum lactatifermentans TaxID=160404 RepID=A0ABS2GDN8_9FIRM|nr:DUF2461 domain-containing protein [Anaerotignum lactatifermentans]MBM6830209.1 DUF2461 domain-containing protein [Anaerotignum lactatifermentans]MBM6878758.1 DUF2461 domain-containing protein [Anaerotignum lactatifermentans]MBM6951822.1 DUF2461 domain-containing protein [Anaerotignum lactatifermentans]
MNEFTGFTPETIDFLWELRMNNNKEWMAENKERYQKVLKEPFDALSKALTTRFLEGKKDLQMDYSISRINRDVRFSKDKSPYKPRKWMVLKEPMTTARQWSGRPVFYFELRPENFEYGMGLYEGKPAYMQAFRKKVDAAPEIFQRLAEETAAQKEFVLYGEEYKRPMGKGGYAPAVMDWYRKKTLGLTAAFEISDVLFQPELVERVVSAWEGLLPMYRYLREIEE